MEKEDNKLNDKFSPIGELMKKDLPPIKWLIDGIIPEEGVAVMAAKPASLKTWVALQMAIDIASGNKLFNKFDTIQAPVLILDGESGERLLKNRLEILGIKADTELPIYYKTYSGGQKFNKSFFENVLGFCLEKGVKLVIIDSLVRFLDIKDKNNAIDVSEAFKRFARLKMVGISVLLIHHCRKNLGTDGLDGLDSVRGSGDIIASCDVGIVLSKKKNTNSVTISVGKNRFDEEGKPFIASFKKESDKVSRWYYVDEITVEDNYLNAAKTIMDSLDEDGEMNQKDLIRMVQNEGIKIGEKKIVGCLNDLVANGSIGRKSGNRTEIIYYLKGESQNG